MAFRVDVPPGYVRIDEPGALIVVRQDAADAVLTAYRAAPPEHRTLHQFASRIASKRALQGRETAYAVALPATELGVVVRHNRHGGALRALTGDLFRGVTRAPLELSLSLALRAAGVPTPPIVAYAVYPARAGFARADVLTEEITNSIDLGALLQRSAPDDDERKSAWTATEALLVKLAQAGARHHDLNLKNILLQQGEGRMNAYVLDVDRLELQLTPGPADAANRARLVRSVEKWRDTRGARVSDAELATLRRTAPSTP